MICPLIQHRRGKLFRSSRDRILAHDDSAEFAYQLIYAVIYLGVDVIGSPRKDDDRKLFALCKFKVFISLFAHFTLICVIFKVCRVGSRFYFPFAEDITVSGKYSAEMLHEFVFIVYSYEIVYIFHARECGNIRADDLRIIGDDRAVEVIRAFMFIYIVAHTRIKYRVDARFQQSLGMTVHKLCRETDGIGRYRMLTRTVKLVVRHR